MNVKIQTEIIIKRKNKWRRAKNIDFKYWNITTKEKNNKKIKTNRKTEQTKIKKKLIISGGLNRQNKYVI